MLSPVPQELDGEHVEEDGGQFDVARQEEVVDVADARHVGGEYLAVLYVQPKELVEVGEDCLVAGGSVGGAEDGDHLETLSKKFVVGVKVNRGINRDCCVDGGAELATLDGVGRTGFEIGRARREGGNFHGVREGVVVIKTFLGGDTEHLELETVGRSPDGDGGCGDREARVDALVDNTRDVVRGEDGKDVEEVMIVEALKEAEVAVGEDAENDGSLGGWLGASTPHRPESGVLAPKPISVGRKEAVARGTGTLTTGGTGQPLEPPGGREIWAWSWEMKPRWAIFSWE